MTRRLPADLEVLVDGEIGEDAALFRHVAEAEPSDLVARAMGDRPPGEDQALGLAGDEAHDGLKRRALAGAVAAEQGDDLAFLDFERDAEQHLGASVERRKTAHF